MNKKNIVVCGATGKQGGAVLRHALKHPEWNIIALSRNPDSAGAQAINNQGIAVKKADLQDKASLIASFKGAQSVFGVTQPWSPDYKKCYPDAEVEQGRNIVDACLQTGVEHLVLSTVAHLKEGRRTGIPHVDSKLDIEEYAKDSGVQHTQIRPAQFMDNIGESYFPIKKGFIRGFVDGDAKVPYISTNDIGAFTALLLENPDEYIGKGLDLVGDFVSGIELCEILSRIRNGEKFKYKAVPRILMRIFAKEFYSMRIAFEEHGRPPYPTDVAAIIEECKNQYPELMTVEQYLISKGFDSIKL